MCDHTFSKLANHQIRHLATHKVGCQPGDCIWSLQSSSGVCVGMHGLTYSLYLPEGFSREDDLLEMYLNWLKFKTAFPYRAYTLDKSTFIFSSEHVYQI